MGTGGVWTISMEISASLGFCVGVEVIGEVIEGPGMTFLGTFSISVSLSEQEQQLTNAFGSFTCFFFRLLQPLHVVRRRTRFVGLWDAHEPSESMLDSVDTVT